MEKTNLLHEVEREEMLNQSYHVKHTEEHGTWKSFGLELIVRFGGRK
jgi:hypothetical protein